MKKIRSLFYILSPIIYGSIIGLLTRNDISYLDSINRNIKIPSIVFPIVWSILYILMGIWAYLEDKEGNDKLVCVFWVSLGLNLLFTPLLFTFNKIFLALLDVILLIILVLYLFINDKSKKRYLLLPYLIWLGVALILMLDLTISNLL